MDNQAFEQFKLNKQLFSAIEEAGYKVPTEIQIKAIPLAMAGHDLLGIAQTGTGKTAAFLIPLLMKVRFAQGQHPRALILAPTRELAVQIGEHIQILAKYLDIRYTVVYGGTGSKIQKENIEKGLDILVATPGRLMDLYLSGDLILKELKTMILDEADKMMDMGFMPQIRKILEVIPRKRQNLLFSATMHPKVVALSEEFLEFPLKVEITPQATPAVNVSQHLYLVPNFKTKINLLFHLISSLPMEERIIVFAKTKENASNISKFIDRKLARPTRVIHGNKSQNTRLNAINEFKDSTINILVATDVASRGLDVSLIGVVINFDVPIIYEDYVHRIGRSGRAGNKGISYTMACPAEEWHIEKIEKLIKSKIQTLPIPSEVTIEETDYEESQSMARVIDELRKKSDPDFKGAFHEKKKVFPTKNKKNNKSSKSKNARIVFDKKSTKTKRSK
jgi:ATP-dependent RNA helicase RhlE